MKKEGLGSISHLQLVVKSELQQIHSKDIWLDKVIDMTQKNMLKN